MTDLPLLGIIWSSNICLNAAAAALVTKLCLTLYNSMDGNPPASSVCGISQVRILVVVQLLSHVRIFATPWTAAY